MPEWEPTTRPWIVCAANRLDNGLLLCGARHWDKVMHAVAAELDVPRDEAARAEQGFIDQFGRFYTREEAMQVAQQNGQVILPPEQRLSMTALFSEDLY